MNMILETRLDKMRRSLDELSAAMDDNLRNLLHKLTCDESAAPMPLKNLDALAKAARENCLMLLAKEHPFAGDLKYAMGALRVGHDYERIQEIAESLNKRVSILHKTAFKGICQDMTGVMADILSMHEIVRHLWKRNQSDDDLKMLAAQQMKLFAGIQVSILAIQNQIMSSISSEKTDAESIVEIVLACRHLKRIAATLNSMPEELHSFG